MIGRADSPPNGKFNWENCTQEQAVAVGKAYMRRALAAEEELAKYKLIAKPSPVPQVDTYGAHQNGVCLPACVYCAAKEGGDYDR